jgi:hypothetical protein
VDVDVDVDVVEGKLAMWWWLCYLESESKEMKNLQRCNRYHKLMYVPYFCTELGFDSK